MKIEKLSWAVLGFLVATILPAAKAASFTGPVQLRVDNLSTPLGIDDPAPRFSWQLQDQARGATQTAYRTPDCLPGRTAR